MVNEKSGAVLISIIVTLGFVTMLILLVLRPLPIGDATTQLLTLLVGVLAAQFANTVQFWLGSSIGSKGKDEVISNLSK